MNNDLRTKIEEILAKKVQATNGIYGIEITQLADQIQALISQHDMELVEILKVEKVGGKYAQCKKCGLTDGIGSGCVSAGCLGFNEAIDLSISLITENGKR